MEGIERDWVSGMYPGANWKNKVKQMSDGQVLAIYLRERKRPAKKNKAKKNNITRESEDTSDEIPF